MPTYSLITRSQKGSKLTTTEMDDNLLYLEELALSTSSGYSFLTYANTGATISTSTVFVGVDSYNFMTLYLPTDSIWIGVEIRVIKTDNSYENSVTINGNFYNGDTTYGLYGRGQVLKTIFDGDQYWIL